MLIFKKRFRLPPTHMIIALAIVDSSFICDVMNFQQKTRKRSDRYEIAPICVRCWTCGRKSPCYVLFYFFSDTACQTPEPKIGIEDSSAGRQKVIRFERHGGQDGERRLDRLSTEIVSGDIQTRF